MAKKKTTKKIAKDNSRRLEDMQNNMMYVSVILGILVIVSLGYNVKVSNQLTDIQSAIDGGTQAAPSPSGDNGDQQQQEAQRVEVEADGAVKGEDDAPVTIIEFSDFECPFCKRFYDDTLSQIEEEYVDSGQVKLVYRHLPLERLHPNAFDAALASECAREQGEFWDYHDMIFENQNQLSTSNYKQWASDLGLDTDEFNSCLDNREYEDKVNQDLQDAREAGATGTPTFFINGQKLVGAHPFNTFQQAIEAELQ